MAQKTKIVSFDDARSASQHRYGENPSAQASRGAGRNRAESRASAPDLRGSSMAGVPDFQYGSTQARSPRPARYDEDDFIEAEPNVRGSQRRGADKREKRRRDRAKSRADKLFDRQFASTANAAQPENAPRAALYEGKMGPSHRKSARMQKASTATPQSAKVNPSGWFSNINISPRLLKVGTAALCLVLTAVFLYIPAQQYYQSVRERDRLAAEYAQIEERNEALNTQNNALSSTAGMEDAVRQKYGYVKSGDETAIVSGLSDDTVDAARKRENVEANVLASSVKAPEEWYTPYLDAFFGVS